MGKTKELFMAIREKEDYFLNNHIYFLTLEPSKSEQCDDSLLLSK
jgi:hypothetical protein